MEDGNTSITTGDGNLFVMSSSSSSPSLSSAFIDLTRNIDYPIDQKMDGHKINNGAAMVESDIYFMSRSRPLQDQSESVIDPGLRSDGCDVIKQEVTKIMNFRIQKNLRKSVKCFMLENYNDDENNKSPDYNNKNQNKINNDIDGIDDQPIDYSIKSKRRKYSENFNINDNPHEQDNYKSPNHFTNDQNIDPHMENNKDEPNIDDYWSQMMKRHHRYPINTNNNFHAMKFQQWSRGMNGFSSQHLNAERIGGEVQGRHFMGKVNFYNAYHADLLQRIFYRDMWMAFQSKGFQPAAFNQNIPNIGGNFIHDPQNIFQHSSTDENHKSLKCLRKNSLVNRLLDNFQSIEDKSNQSRKHILADEPFTDIPGKSCNKNMTEPNNTNPSSVKRLHKDKSIAINTNQYGAKNRSGGCLGDFICQLCNERFDDAIGLAGHNCSKMAKVKYECPQCDKVFNCPANLASHRRWHRPKQF